MAEGAGYPPELLFPFRFSGAGDPLAFDYAGKFESFRAVPVYGLLGQGDRETLRELAFTYRFTYQEFRQVAEACRDLSIWGEPGLTDWLRARRAASAVPGSKAGLLADLKIHMKRLRERPKVYGSSESYRPLTRSSQRVVERESNKKIIGMCPVASEKTVCCNLRTIDAIENCVFGCSYCAVQTFYRDEVAFDKDFARKLASIELDPDRTYHVGTGQASDSLAFGNRNGILDDLCAFARGHPNVLLELKTKSDNVRFFLENDCPENVVCSWSLNSRLIAETEEHFTASLEKRIESARAVADRGVMVAFHFHPMVHHHGWIEGYGEVARDLIDRFDSSEVSFLSFGSVTLIKPVLQKIRELGNPTRIHQMELVPDPHGKLTYPDEIKVEMFSAMHERFARWRDEVFIYLCMEKAEIWERAFGYVYPTNEIFEREFARWTMPWWNGARSRLTSASSAGFRT